MKKQIFCICMCALLVGCGSANQGATTSSSSTDLPYKTDTEITKINENAQNDTEDAISIEGTTYVLEGEEEFDNHTLEIHEALDEEMGGGYYCSIDGLGFTTKKSDEEGYVFTVFAQDGSEGTLTYDSTKRTMTLEIDGDMSSYQGVYELEK